MVRTNSFTAAAYRHRVATREGLVPMSLLMPHSPGQAHADVFGSGTEAFPPERKSKEDVTPSEVHNVALWRHAWQLMNQHQSATDSEQVCVSCNANWPCEPYRHGQVDEVASRRRP